MSSSSAEITTFSKVNEIVNSLCNPHNIIRCRIYTEQIKDLITNNTIRFNKDEKKILSENLLNAFDYNYPNRREFIKELYDEAFEFTMDEDELKIFIQLQFPNTQTYQFQFECFVKMLRYINL